MITYYSNKVSYLCLKKNPSPTYAKSINVCDSSNVRANSCSPLRGSSASDTSDRFIYNRSSGELFFDPDGTGSMDEIERLSINISSFSQPAECRVKALLAGLTLVKLMGFRLVMGLVDSTLNLPTPLFYWHLEKH